MEEKELLQTIIESIQEKKGHKITTVDLTEIESASANYFVICQGNTPTQVEAIADSVRQYTREHTGVKPIAYEGYRNAQWIIIDYGNIFVHIFLPESRDFYRLEQLWNDAKLTVVARLLPPRTTME